MRRPILVSVVFASIAVGLMALASIASAAPEVDFTVPLPVEASGSGGQVTLTTVGGTSVTCSSSVGKGVSTSNTTAEGTTTFKGCTSSGFSCTSSGLASGEIGIGTLLGHLVYIKGFTHTVGVLVTAPANGVVTEFNCSFLIHAVVTGNGIIGHVDSPACGAKSASSTVSGEQSSPGVQRYQEIEGSTTKYHLNVAFNGGAAEEVSLVGSATGTLAGGAEGTLTCN